MLPTPRDADPLAARGPQAPRPAPPDGPAPRRFRHLLTVSAPLELPAESLRSLLPEPLLPSSTTARITFGRWDDEVVGEHEGVGVYVPTQIDGEAGAFVAGMYVDSDRSLIVGRELFGEPKFFGATDFRFGERGVDLEMTRHGTSIALRGALDAGERSGVEARRSFNLKGHLTVDGARTMTEPSLTATDWEANLARVRSGRARLRITGATRDLLGFAGDRESEVDVTLSEGIMEGHTRHVAWLDPQSVVPLLHRRLGLER